MVCVAYPMQLTLRLDPAGTWSLNAPSTSVTAPIEAFPTTVTAAPITGAPVASTTVPLMERFWADAVVPNKLATKMIAAATLANNCLAINRWGF